MESRKFRKIAGTLMDAPNIIWQHWEKQYQVFRDNLQKISLRPARTAVHDIRVAIKKMRSYLRLVNKLTGEDWKEPFSAYMQLFKTLGRLRDFEMSISLLGKFQKGRPVQFVSLKKYFSQNKSFARSRVKDAVKKFDAPGLEKLLQLFSHPETGNTALHEKIKSCCRENLDKANDLSGHFTKHAHEIRKLLKDVYYWLLLLPPEVAKQVTRIKALDKTLKALGFWQDYFILSVKLKQYRKDFLVKGTEEDKQTGTLLEEIKQRQERLLETIDYFK
jgi:CHAD domain-containing protein